MNHAGFRRASRSRNEYRDLQSLLAGRHLGGRGGAVEDAMEGVVPQDTRSKTASRKPGEGVCRVQVLPRLWPLAATMLQGDGGSNQSVSDWAVSSNEARFRGSALSGSPSSPALRRIAPGLKYTFTPDSLSFLHNRHGH